MTSALALLLLIAATVISADEEAASSTSAEALPHYISLFEGGATPQEKLLMDWLYDLKFAHAGNTVQRNMGLAGRGMVYTQNVQRGEELFSVPTKAMLYTSNPLLHPSTKKVLELFREYSREPGRIADDFELTEMGLVVLFEKRNSKSAFKHYLSGLQFPLCPAFYSEDKMQAFEYPWLTDWRKYFLQDSIKNFDLLLEKPEFSLLKTDSLREDFMWAVSTVLQRSFDWGPDARREYVMVPFLDMINHKANVSNNYYYSSGFLTIKKPSGNVVKKPIERGMVIAADAEHKAGDEVAISYSMGSSNVQMLLQYGFVVKDNMHDYIVLQLQAPPDRPDFHDVIRELGGVLASITTDFTVPVEFVKAVALIMTGEMKLTVEAYELVQSCIKKDLESFSTSLESDQNLMNTGKLDRLDFSVVAYRIEAKTFLTKTLDQMEKDIATVKKGGTPTSAPRSGRKDWPLRHIVVQPKAGFKPADGEGSKSADASPNDKAKKEL